MVQRSSFPEFIFSDFDGTLTSAGGAITSEFHQLLEMISQRSAKLVVVTGRSTAWGLFLLTHFPQIHAVVTEGGGVALTRQRTGLNQALLCSQAAIDSISSLKSKLELAFPKQLEHALDNTGRLSDYALELTPLLKDLKLKQKVEEELKAWGAHFTQSNVHINITFHEINKWESVQHWCVLEGIVWSDIKARAIFFGDSLNDESMFANFEYSVGVANIKSCIKQMKFPPKTILEGHENEEIHGVLNYLKVLK
jgi:HAD superfamily hydrolase (TIGR01484 family)